MTRGDPGTCRRGRAHRPSRGSSASCRAFVYRTWFRRRYPTVNNPAPNVITTRSWLRTKRSSIRPARPKTKSMTPATNRTVVQRPPFPSIDIDLSIPSIRSSGIVSHGGIPPRGCPVGRDRSPGFSTKICDSGEFCITIHHYQNRVDRSGPDWEDFRRRFAGHVGIAISASPSKPKSPR